MANRAERRRQERAKQKAATPPTYNMSLSSLKGQIAIESDIYFKKKEREIKEKITSEAINTAMCLLLTLPMRVLMDDYWKKSYKKKLPEFSGKVLELYEKWNAGEIDMDQLEAEMWVWAGFKFQENGENTQDGNIAPVEYIEVDNEIATYTVEKDNLRGRDRYITRFENPHGGEAIFYAWSMEVLQKKVEDQIKAWEQEGAYEN